MILEMYRLEEDVLSVSKTPSCAQMFEQQSIFYTAVWENGNQLWLLLYIQANSVQLFGKLRNVTFETNLLHWCREKVWVQF